MINVERDILSLTDFKRNTNDVVKQMKETKSPVVLTVNGKAELVVQDAASFQAMVDELDRLEAIEGIRRGLEGMKAGNYRPVEEVFTELREKWGIKDE